MLSNSPTEVGFARKRSGRSPDLHLSEHERLPGKSTSSGWKFFLLSSRCLQLRGSGGFGTPSPHQMFWSINFGGNEVKLLKIHQAKAIDAPPWSVSLAQYRTQR